MKKSGHRDTNSEIPGLATGYEYWNFRFNNTGYNSAAIHLGDGGIYFVPKPVSLALEECKSMGEIGAVIKDFQRSRSQYFIGRDAVKGLGFKFMRAKKNDWGMAVLEFSWRTCYSTRMREYFTLLRVFQ